MRQVAYLVVELVVLFLVVSFLVEISQRRLGPQRLKSWMGGRPLVAALKGIAVGFVTPFCTYSAIPLLIGLRRAGVAPAGYVAFISAAPVLDPVLFGALVLIVGPVVAVSYVVVTFVAALGLALTAHHLGVERHLKPIDGSSSTQLGTAGGTACGSASELSSLGNGDGRDLDWAGWSKECKRATRASAALLGSFGPLLLAGIAVGVGIEAVVSPEAAAQLTTGSAVFAIPTAAALSTPLYFSTELFVPIANSLRNAGVGVGAIVALTIAGAGANIPEFVVLTRLAKPKIVSVFFGYVFLVAVMGGFLAHALRG